MFKLIIKKAQMIHIKEDLLKFLMIILLNKHDKNVVYLFNVNICTNKA